MQALVWAMGVVVPSVLRQDAAEMLLTDDQHVVQASAAKTPSNAVVNSCGTTRVLPQVLARTLSCTASSLLGLAWLGIRWVNAEFVGLFEGALHGGADQRDNKADAAYDYQPSRHDRCQAPRGPTNSNHRVTPICWPSRCQDSKLPALSPFVPDGPRCLSYTTSAICSVRGPRSH